MPAYTHMQRAEPVLVSHWLLAYVEMLLRDAERLEDCRKRLNVCPLGSGAVAGSTLPLDRELMSARTWVHFPHREQRRCHQRSGFRAGIRECAVYARVAPEPLGGRDAAVLYAGVRIHSFTGGILNRQQRHAAKNEWRSARTYARQSGARHRRCHFTLDCHQGPATRIQQRSAGNSGATFSRHRNCGVIASIGHRMDGNRRIRISSACGRPPKPAT